MPSNARVRFRPEVPRFAGAFAFLRVVFFAGDFRAADFFRAGDFFLAADFFLPVVFFRAADFFLVDFLAADFLRVDFFAADLRRVDFFAVPRRLLAFRAVFFRPPLFAAIEILLDVKDHFPATARSPRSATRRLLNRDAKAPSGIAAAASALSSRLAGTYNR